MLAALALAELLGMSLWFSATAVTPSLTEAFQLSPGEIAWLTMAVQAGFVAGTLATAVANLADVVNPRVLMGAGCLAGAVGNAGALVAAGPAELIATRVLTGVALAWAPLAVLAVAAVAMGVWIGADWLGTDSADRGYGTALLAAWNLLVGLWMGDEAIRLRRGEAEGIDSIVLGCSLTAVLAGVGISRDLAVPGQVGLIILAGVSGALVP